VKIVVAYFVTDRVGAELPLAGPPAGKGQYRVLVSFSGDNRYMGASKEIALIIQ
jgi:hypothetical protein